MIGYAEHTEEWRADAACAGADPELWFAGVLGELGDVSGRGMPRDVRDRQEQAVAICETCPVRDDCLEWALVTDERFGIWGGLLPNQRRSLRRGRGMPPVRTPGHQGHGTRYRYQQGCRCDDCRAANADYVRRSRDELEATGRRTR